MEEGSWLRNTACTTGSGSSLLDRPSTTSSNDSVCVADMDEFVSEIQSELIEQHGAAGVIRKEQLCAVLSRMGLDATDGLLTGLWVDTDTPQDQPLPVHQVLQGISTRVTISPSEHASTPQSKRSKSSPTRGPPSPFLWWGTKPLADAL
eukprot:TRINITY_DN35238_c0_g1_i1.p1 TRINITY_DN35238_c0_g1~~TRINITY_DN35238_c0_g1_i1.p1  ORF type:complete len:170 (+),score=34.65 TRINITY_DN35238_c0_g1_i1:65-511(+)